MQLRWHVWHMPIKLALCSIYMALMLYHLAGAPTRSKEKSIGTFEPKAFDGGQSSNAGVALISTLINEPQLDVNYWSYQNNSDRKCYDLTLIISSASPKKVDPATCSSQVAYQISKQNCRAACSRSKEDYSLGWFAKLKQRKAPAVPNGCLQSDKANVVDAFQFEAELQIDPFTCQVSCSCQISNKIKVRMPVVKSGIRKHFAVSPLYSKDFWHNLQSSPWDYGLDINSCHPTDMLSSLSVPGFTPSDPLVWLSRYEVTAERSLCDQINWDTKCFCKKAYAREHYFRPLVCGEKPVPESERPPSQRGGKSRKARVDSAAKGPRVSKSKKARVDSATEGPQPVDANSHSLDGTTAHITHPAGPTTSTVAASQEVLPSFYEDLGDLSGFSDLLNELSFVQPNEYGLPQFPTWDDCFYSSPYPSLGPEQCQASHGPYASQPTEHTGQYSGDPYSTYEQQQCGSSTSCNPAQSGPFKKREETRRDEGDAGSRCAPASGAGHEKRPAPFI